MGADFKIRALEIHSLYAWDFSHVMKTMDIMDRLSFNTLIIHRNDIVEMLEYPGFIFGYEKKVADDSLFDVYGQCFRKIFRNTPTRRSNIFNKRAYMKRILAEAGKKGISVYIENKELYFPDILPELRPELIRDGHVCPTDPYWTGYIKAKFSEFFRDYPEIKGVITSIATSESKISIKSNRCHCERCKSTRSEDWYRTILRAMHDVLSSLGKELVVRDFVFDSQSQKEIASVMEGLDDDVIISLKNTPHDYYPTFPVNKRIGDVGNHRQWVEFDTMGQYYGMGVGVADLMEDYRFRLEDAKKKGVEGVIFRTDWESLDGHSVFKTPNLINVYSAAMLSLDVSTPARDIYGRFADAEGWICGDREKAVDYLKSVYENTWSITSRTVFADGCVFSDSSTMPISMEHALWLAEEKNSLRDWVPEKKDSLSPLRSSLEKVFREKDEALEDLNRIIGISDAVPPSINKEKGEWLKNWMHVNKLYLEMFSTCTKAVMDARYLTQSTENDEAFRCERRKSFSSQLSALLELEEQFSVLWAKTDYAEHVIYTLLDPDRIRCLRRNLMSLNII